MLFFPSGFILFLGGFGLLRKKPFKCWKLDSLGVGVIVSDKGDHGLLAPPLSFLGVLCEMLGNGSVVLGQLGDNGLVGGSQMAQLVHAVLMNQIEHGVSVRRASRASNGCLNFLLGSASDGKAGLDMSSSGQETAKAVPMKRRGCGCESLSQELVEHWLLLLLLWLALDL